MGVVEGQRLRSFARGGVDRDGIGSGERDRNIVARSRDPGRRPVSGRVPIPAPGVMPTDRRHMLPYPSNVPRRVPPHAVEPRPPLSSALQAVTRRAFRLHSPYSLKNSHKTSRILPISGGCTGGYLGASARFAVDVNNDSTAGISGDYLSVLAGLVRLPSGRRSE